MVSTNYQKLADPPESSKDLPAASSKTASNVTMVMTSDMMLQRSGEFVEP